MIRVITIRSQCSSPLCPSGHGHHGKHHVFGIAFVGARDAPSSLSSNAQRLRSGSSGAHVTTGGYCRRDQQVAGQFFALLVIGVLFFRCSPLSREGRLFKPLAYTKNPCDGRRGISHNSSTRLRLLITNLKNFNFKPSGLQARMRACGTPLKETPGSRFLIGSTTRWRDGAQTQVW